ncbi:hypothetical protein [Alkalicoccus halolimnae]|uniref:Uncharacterized protein n=1 Tax=Alkalicoccus halolimnae TaxID=1667239 RepID=A0A5C7FN26_9BACI|nr:hypothetical protein [Alkalicoccus halolimnae]TXF86175.1 hypothetical protein FTX54_06065 [Alkalicoccus halolimnae]
MKKLLPFVFLLAACGAEEENTEITGQNLGTSENGTPIVLFVEDNLNGEELTADYVRDFDSEEYEVEAYQVAYDEDTEIVYLETEEEVENPVILEAPVPKEMRVIMDDAFEPQVSRNRENYILEDSSLLPVVRAERIEIEYTNLETIHSYIEEAVLPSYDGGFVLALLEDDSKEAMEFAIQNSTFHEKLNEPGSDRGNWSINGYSHEMTEAIAGDEVIYPSYFIYQEGRQPHRVESIEEVFNYVDDL